MPVVGNDAGIRAESNAARNTDRGVDHEALERRETTGSIREGRARHRIAGGIKDGVRRELVGDDVEWIGDLTRSDAIQTRQRGALCDRIVAVISLPWRR